jgi:signal transduction histidine kinase
VGQSILKVLENDNPSFKDTLEKALQVKEFTTTLFIEQYTYELRTHAIYDHGEVESIVCIFLDITERIERERTRLEKELTEIELIRERELNEMRKQLMITLSHELRTPLAAIRSASDLLTPYNDKLTPEKRKRRLLSIQEQVAHLTNILQDIDVVVRNDHEVLVFDHQTISTAFFAEQVINRLSSKYPHEVRLDYSPDAEVIYNDARWLTYIIGNLLSNAAQYSENGLPIDLRFSRKNDYIVIEIEDYGMGIAPDEIDKLFHAFYRAPNALDISGTGLGLVIAQNIVNAQGGSIKIESQLGVGTTVTVYLHVKPKASAKD